MLSCENLTVRVSDNAPPILKAAKAAFMPNALNAVIGPSGCGKTTLVKAMLGILKAEGDVSFCAEPVKRSEDLIGRVGFAPQFSIAPEHLTVAECLAYALDLCCSDKAEKQRRLNFILGIIGLAEHREKRVNSLSGGQLRRLGLGIELTPDPPCMICDEVTSGLDPRSEEQILELLQTLSREQGKTFVNIIHNLGKLHFFDFITVVYEGCVVFQGTHEELLSYFGITDALTLYDVLNKENADYWLQRWQEYAPGGYEFEVEAPPRSEYPLPSSFSQFSALLRRRCRLFLRDRGFLFLTLAITVGFPFMVVIFALDGLPQIESLPLEPLSSNAMQTMQEKIAYKLRMAETAQLVTGLVMFQVILLTLMGSNNGAREIAAERTLYEKERLNGLRPTAYALSKILFVSLIALTQGLIMTLLVKYICEFPGSLLAQSLILTLCCGSMTLLCLGFSAMMTSPEKASALSIYLVGFQLPLSGVVLALPEFLVWVCRPFINAYWSWAGYIGSMKHDRFYDALQAGKPLWVPELWLSLSVLAAHGVVGLILIFWGCQKKRWN